MRRWFVWIGFVVLAIVVAAVVAVGQASSDLERPAIVPWGDPERGRDLAAAVGCNSCHTIPGVKGADATVGPPLTRWSERTYIAGTLTNGPENLARWLLDPGEVEPGTAMPDLGLSRQQVQDIVAYLFTID